MTALSHAAQAAWAELVYADRRGWEIAEQPDCDRTAAFREAVTAELSTEREDGRLVYFRLTDHGRLMWSAE